MSKNTIIWIIVIVILVGLGFWYFSSSNTTPNIYTQTGATTTTTTTSSATTVVTNPNTFHSIFTQSGNHLCSYEQASTSARSSSAIYISDGQMRGEFRTTTGSGSTATLMIYNGGYLYTWKEGTTAGTKTSIKTLADLPQVIPTDLTSGAIFGVSSDNVSWDCHDWIRDNTYFTIPSYVRFSAK